MKNKKIGKKKMRIIAVLTLVTGLIISPIIKGKLDMQVDADTAVSHSNVQNDAAVNTLQNGDFENPSFNSAENWNWFDASLVPGWQTTASDNQIELLKTGFIDTIIQQTFHAQSGTQWAELNAHENSALYQDISTTPGTKIRWQVYHMGRQKADIAIAEFGAPGGALIEQVRMTDGNSGWGEYKGSYTIPEGQTTTRFQFRAVSNTGEFTSRGNYLDNVQFTTPSELQVKGQFSLDSIKIGQSADYQLEAKNIGGMTAVNNQFSVRIPNELSYTTGRLTSANTRVSQESYNEATRTLTFKTDSIAKNATVNVTIPLTGSSETSAASPDTAATYSDENFEEESYNADAVDDAIAVRTDERPVLTGEAETVIQLNALFDPMSTIRATDKEDGDITAHVRVTSNSVDTSQSGRYAASYEVTDSDGNKATFNRTIIVKDIPAITGERETRLNPNVEFDPMSTIRAADKEDGDITSRVVVTNNPVDTSKSDTYEVSYEVADSDGNKATFIRTVIVTAAPLITGEMETRLNPNAEFDPMSTIGASDKEDGEVTSQVEITSNNVDTSKPDTYQVSYEVTDSDGNKAVFTRTVLVTEMPLITGEAKTRLNPNAKFDPMSTINATDEEDGDITSQVEITSNNVDTSKSDTYEVSYEVTDSDGNKAFFIRTVIVTEAPVITGQETITLKQGELFDPFVYLTAQDKEDGNLTAKIEIISNNVNTNYPDTYQVFYKVTDSDGNVAEFTREVIVQAELLKLSEPTKTLPKSGDTASTKTVVLGFILLTLGMLLLWRKKKKENKESVKVSK
ncbi:MULTISPECIES: immunoglobulin-like domain-containing protein [Listeria]|uniref:immunoglobulin-like domain-containing protein n=1 Tax=Listeria TaxID=1637 RepID=UPI000B594161|nr:MULTISPECIES: immunoglobulin-like domain-containing protein [Listeria]